MLYIHLTVFALLIQHKCLMIVLVYGHCRVMCQQEAVILWDKPIHHYNLFVQH